MATRAAQLRHVPSRRTAFWPGFREFIRWEVAPYPGRVNTVARMTIAATLVMVTVVTFRIPNAALAGLFSILLARENLAATWRGGRMIVMGFVGASAYTLLGTLLFRGSPVTHFFWVIASFYLIFFVLRTATNYAAVLAFAIPIGVALPIWDRPSPSELQVENTLWLIVIIAIGAGVTVATEVFYRIFDRSDPLIVFVDDVLLAVQQVAESVASLHAPPKPVVDRLLQYQMIGTGRLRTTLQRQGLNPKLRAQRSALISIVGRLVGLAVGLERSLSQPGDDDTIRLRALAERLVAIRKQLREPGAIPAVAPVLEGQPSSAFPTLQEMERVVAVLTEVLQPDEMVDGAKPTPGPSWWRALFLPDAFQNPEYLHFAFTGCLAASICYVLYNALDWPGINTSLLTCVVTALGTIGFSLQAQLLRLAGFVTGGLLLGISAQILILPGIDTIFGFALFFAIGTAIAAWFATSSPRLAFFGVQMALAFYFVNLQDFHIQTDLTIARDKVLGVLLGILVMGFVFDRFGTKSDAEQLQKLLVRNIRMLAQLGVCPVMGDRAITVSQIRRLRSQINDNFAGLESQTDAARFESQFRGRSQEKIAECDRIQRAQPALRSIFLLELTLLSYRVRRESGIELTRQQNQALDVFLNKYSGELMHIAAWIAHEAGAPAGPAGDSSEPLVQMLQENNSANSRVIADICQKMSFSLSMLRNEC
jgi:multidrug resistance protein MdtO